jgi:hypothetical protein
VRVTRLAALAFVTGAIMTLPFGARAHNISDYPGDGGWKYTILNRIFYTHPTQWPSSFNNRTDDAMAKWTSLTGSGLSQQRNGTAPTGNWSCGAAFDMLRYAFLSGPALGATLLCTPVNSTVRITMDTAANWYTGSSTPDPSNQPDFQGLITHELGHAHQAWAVCTNDPDATDPCPGNHYDTTHNGAICDQSGMPAQYSTMCTSVSTTNSWRWRSLETHDQDLVESAY